MTNSTEAKESPAILDFVIVSPLTNRPINKENPEDALSLFYCVLCEKKLINPTLAIQHFTGKSHAALVKSKQVISHQQTPSNVNTNLKRQYDLNSGAKPLESYSKAPDSKKNKLTVDPPNLNDLHCQVCNNTFNSPVSRDQHYQGRKHKNALAGAALLQKVSPVKQVPIASSTTNVKGNSFAKYHCTFCDISLNSDEQMTQHCNGIRHKLKSGEIKEPPSWWVEQQDSLSQTTNKKSSGKGVGDPFKCETCSIFLNSETQLGQHLASAKHKDRLKGGKKPTSNTPVKGRGITNGGSPAAGRGVSNRGRGGGRGRGILGQQNGVGRGNNPGNDKSWYNKTGNNDKGNPNYMAIANNRAQSYRSFENAPPLPMPPPYAGNMDPYAITVPYQSPVMGPRYNENFVRDSQYDQFYR